MARVLVVDDETDMRLALTTILSRSGHSVSEGSDGEAALRFLSMEKVDIVLLDIRMPGIDGLQVLKHLVTFRCTNHEQVKNVLCVGRDLGQHNVG